MTQYITKFEAWRSAAFTQLDADEVVSGWTARYGGTISRVPTLGPVDKTYGWSSRAVFGASSATGSWDAVDADAGRANAEVLAGCVSGQLMIAYAGFIYESWRVFARGSAANTTYYSAQIDQGGDVKLISTVSGTDTVLATVNIGALTFPYRAWLRLRVNGTSLSAKAWLIDAAEPGAWTVTATDGTITAAGYVGVNGQPIEFMSVGTSGDVALAPRTLKAASDAICRASTSGQPLVCTLDMEPPGSNGPSGLIAGRVVRRYANVSYDAGTVGHVGALSGMVYPARLTAIPQLSREIDDAAGGVVRVGGANFDLDNGDGSLDDLARLWLKRASVTVRIGLPAWPWYDLMPYLTGVIDEVSGDDKRLTLGVDTSMRELDGDITATNITTGPSIGKPVPQLYGYVINAAPVLVDAANLVYQYHDGANRHVPAVRDKGASLVSPVTLTLTAFDAAADTLTASAAHGRTVGDLVVIGGTPPAPLVAGALYEIKTVPATDKLTLTATRGGAMIDLTGASGAITATAEVRLWFGGSIAPTGIVSPTGTITLARKPDGLITLDAFEVPHPTLSFSPPLYPRVALKTASLASLVKILGVPRPRLGARDGDYGAEPMAAFLSERTSRMSVADMLVASGAPLTASRSGIVARRRIRLDIVELALTEADCFGVPRLLRVLAASKIKVGPPNAHVMSPTDFAGTVSVADIGKYGNAQISLADGKGVDGIGSVVWGGLSLDATLYRDQRADESIFDASGIYETSNKARQRPAQIFQVDIAMRSLLVDPGDVVSLTHRRHFFKDVTNEIDVSPERPATAIGAKQQPSLAVVTKIVDDPANSRQVLTLYRPMPTLFPAS